MKIKILVITLFITVFLANDIEDNQFKFNQSTIQAFYFIIDARIYNEPLEEGVDWIIAYHNNQCIGARKWNGPYTDIPVMGNDGSDYSKGYINAGEIPVFKIYDSSQDIFYEANLSEKVPYPKGMVGMIEIDLLDVQFDISEISKNTKTNIQELNKTTQANYQIFNNYRYEQPKHFSYLMMLPNDLKKYSKIVFNRDYLKEFAQLSLITGVLIYYDVELIQKTRELNNKLNLNISYTDQMKVIAEPFEQPIRVPSDLGSALYFIGDGWTHFGLSMSFYLKGRISNDNRALQTSSQILQGMASAGFVTQVLKHITGRTSPFKGVKGVWENPGQATRLWNDGSTDIEDRWDFFPNQIEYHKHVSSYDAFPSGHLAVFMSTFTIISENYPEYPIIKPVGYTLMTLLGLQMMNNGVHWASDYPLSIAMGYYLGKIAVDNGRKIIDESNVINYEITPYVNTNSFGLNFKYYFD